MNWLELHIDTNHQGLEPVEAMLSSLGIDGISIEDEEEFRDFLEGNRQYWDYVDEDLDKRMTGRSRITFYLPAGGDGFAKMGEVRLALEALRAEGQDWGPLLMTLNNVQDGDWENSWKQYYKPMEIGERLIVVPQWEAEETETGDRVPLLLDPGLTFGTGGHATTRMCLTALEKIVSGGERVLDLGCGSGILSIAALRLGAASARAVDIDPMCQNVAYDNAALNGIRRDTLEVLVGNVLGDGSFLESLGGGYDLVLANIVADVILGIAPLVKGLLKPGGVFLCSGIIEGRTLEVCQGLTAAGLDIEETYGDNGWYAYLCKI
ncbi:MAG: 50S ribosomal protein L11 methyltransferase [Oscillibacter sp.]|nr:50S ribosomal protein L11 methyltransferase [Oscillibacter sp.]